MQGPAAFPRNITLDRVSEKLDRLSEFVDKAVDSTAQVVKESGKGGMYFQFLDAFVDTSGDRVLSGLPSTVRSEFGAWREFPPKYVTSRDVALIKQGVEQAKSNAALWFGEDQVLSRDEYEAESSKYAKRPGGIGTFIAPSVLRGVIKAMISNR